jgi:hypothetical protein
VIFNKTFDRSMRSRIVVVRKYKRQIRVSDETISFLGLLQEICSAIEDIYTSSVRIGRRIIGILSHLRRNISNFY